MPVYNDRWVSEVQFLMLVNGWVLSTARIETGQILPKISLVVKLAGYEIDCADV